MKSARWPARWQNSATTSAYRELVQFLHDVDVLILDTQYTADEYKHRAGWGHGCLPDSVRLATDAGVRRLLLFHHDPSHDDRQIDQMVESARALAVGAHMKIDAASETQPISLTRLSGQALKTGIADVRPWPVRGQEKAEEDGEFAGPAAQQAPVVLKKQTR